MTVTQKIEKTDDRINIYLVTMIQCPRSTMFERPLNVWYSGDLNTGLVWYSNGQKLSDRRMVRYSNAI